MRWIRRVGRDSIRFLINIRDLGFFEAVRQTRTVWDYETFRTRRDRRYLASGDPLDRLEAQYEMERRQERVRNFIYKWSRREDAVYWRLYRWRHR